MKHSSPVAPRPRSIIGFLWLCWGCASAPPPPAAEAASAPPPPAEKKAEPAPAEAAASTPAPVSEAPPDEPVMCDLVCEHAQVVRRKEDAAADIAQATADADRVLQSMQGDLLACYKKRIRTKPDAHAFMTLDILVGPEGKVRDVETQGGALLGDQTMSCIVNRVRRGTFPPPKGGGTIRIQVPFSLRPANERA